MEMSNKYKQKGQSLIEALVALGAAVLVVSAITISVITALNNVQYTKNQNLAAQYAQQAMEIMRQTSSSNWTLFSSYPTGTYCLDEGTSLLRAADPATSFCGQNYGIFVREVDIKPNATKCVGGILTIVIVSWSDSKCTDTSNTYCHSVELDSCFDNVNSTIFNTP